MTKSSSKVPIDSYIENCEPCVGLQPGEVITYTKEELIGEG
jgi:hypothetical protein